MKPNTTNTAPAVAAAVLVTGLIIAAAIVLPQFMPGLAIACLAFWGWALATERKGAA